MTDKPQYTPQYTADQEHAATVILSDPQFLAGIKAVSDAASAKDFVLAYMSPMAQITGMQTEATRLGEANVNNLKSLHSYIDTNLAGDPRLEAIKLAYGILANAFNMPDEFNPLVFPPS